MKPEASLQWHSPEHVVKSLQRTYKILRGNVSYGNFDPADTGRNIDGFPAIAVTHIIPGTEFSVSHGLNRIPVGFHVVNKDGATDVFRGVTAWTTTKIFLKATGGGISITLFIF